MPVKHPLLIAALMLGVSTAVLHSQGLVGGDDAPAAPAALFGAPAARAASASNPSFVAVNRPSAEPVSSGPWVLDRPRPQADGSDGRAAPAPASVDVSALHYYAHENDLARVAAEIRLLRARHPGWTPPDDLFTEAVAGESEQPLWDLFAKHDIDGLKAAIDERRQRTPGWMPSNDLSSKLALADSYSALVTASDGQDWATVLDLAAANRGLMTCGNVDAIWRTAEALVQSGDEAHAVDAYRYVLTSCTKSQERLATVQKASALLKSPDAIDGLIKLGKRSPGGVNEFDQVRLDELRRKIGDMAAGKAGPAATPAEIDQLTAIARTPGGRADAELLGWLAYSKKDFAQAESWFRLSLQAGPTAKGAEGLVLALRDGGKAPEATTLAVQYAGLDHLNRKLMVEVLASDLSSPAATPLPAEQITALATGIDDEKSADAAQSYGWFRYKAGDLAGAQSWFRKAADWQPSESAAVGLVLTASRLKQADYGSLVARYRTVYPRVAELDTAMTAGRSKHGGRNAGHVHVAKAGRGDGGWDKSATAIVDTFQNGDVNQAMAMLDQRKAAHRSEPNGLAVVRGWAMYKKGDWDGAKQVFNDLKAKGMDQEAMEGIRVIDRGYLPPNLR